MGRCYINSLIPFLQVSDYKRCLIEENIGRSES